MFHIFGLKLIKETFCIFIYTRLFLPILSAKIFCLKAQLKIGFATIRFANLITASLVLFFFLTTSSLYAQMGMMGMRPTAMPPFINQPTGQQDPSLINSQGQLPLSANSPVGQNFGGQMSAQPSGASSAFATQGMLSQGFQVPGISSQGTQVPLTQNPPIVPPSAGSIPVTTDSRIKTLVYNANEVYELKFHYGYQSYIEFANTEEVEMISIGESFAWRLTPAGKRLFVRPLEIGAHTNMTVITNKRTYQFDIVSSEYDGRADEELVYIVRFYYPEIGIPLPIPPQLTRPAITKAVTPLKPIVKTPIPQQYVNRHLTQEVTKNEDDLNFLYSIVGRSDNIVPLKVYDDGSETFFQFKDKNLIVPSINSVDLFGNEKPMGYAIREGFVVVSGVHTQFTLRLADSLICIFNEKIAAAPANKRIDFYQKDFIKSTKP